MLAPRGRSELRPLPRSAPLAAVRGVVWRCPGVSRTADRDCHDNRVLLAPGRAPVLPRHLGLLVSAHRPARRGSLPRRELGLSKASRSRRRGARALWYFSIKILLNRLFQRRRLFRPF